MFKRILRVIAANFPVFVPSPEDPEQILQVTFCQLQTNLSQLRQGIAAAIATQKRSERQVQNARSQAEEWYGRAQLALQQSNEALARVALTKRQTYLETVTSLSHQIEQYRGVISQLKQDLGTLEAKMVELKLKKDLYIARARSAEANYQLQEMLNSVSNVSGLDAWKRMEERIGIIEAQAEVLALTDRDQLGEKFARWESNQNVDTELSAMKSQIFPEDK
jgi:phage shock protein A